MIFKILLLIMANMDSRLFFIPYSLIAYMSYCGISRVSRLILHLNGKMNECIRFPRFQNFARIVD